MLFDNGVDTPEVSEHRDLLRTLIDTHIRPTLTHAENAGLFPREVMTHLGAADIIRDRWRGHHGDRGRAALLHEELAAAGCGGVAVGISLTLETVTGILRRFARGPAQMQALDGLLDGRLVGCLGASEPTGGSDLLGMRSTIRRDSDGWQVRAEKKFLSLGQVCDFALLLCGAQDSDDDPHAARPLTLVMVPRDALRIVKPLSKIATSSLDTTWMRCDTWVPDDAVVGRVGLGLPIIGHGLTHERYAIAAQVLGLGARAIGLTAAHLHRRQQFGRPLVQHQALRLRLADLAAQLTTLRYGVYGAAATGDGALAVRDAAALKVTATRMVEQVTQECMHMFGGAGYLTDETPMARLWQEARLGRIGAGTDETMWELVAGGIQPDFESYRREVDLTPPNLGAINA
ncbi:acyl-CoA dehydrogenase family protein [Micromonospora sp. BRA006-A]|uniref:acyl-CoA dehydrogenase family protein n=1 Tax=Micromonospora sp. BRA006-A TaxID=2962860 RepID=UPI00296F9783|nr:acyl-CoA dehydrogenase family protein [Micromonospora sp. BRA006-A]MDW3845663.1 acyl-CoA dehydrogenase family protein [Micromonospora sp. BRA006-A]